MVAEAWIVKMGNQVSTNLKHALLLENSGKKKTHNSAKLEQPRHVLGILSFEVANIMSKTVHLHKSLCDGEISRLRNEISKSEGVVKLVSSDESRVLELALVEKLDELNRVAAGISRFGKKCSEPALQGFEHVYGDIVSGAIDVKELGFLVKDMEGMIRKMERYVGSTASLYNELEVLNELEQATKKFHNNQHEESRRAFEQKLAWQRQDVRHLKEVSLWSQTFDKVVELLARTACTIYARICLVFGESAVLLKRDVSSSGLAHLPPSTPLKRVRSNKRASRHPQRRAEVELFHAEDFNFPCVTSPGKIFMDCLSLSSSASTMEGYYDGDSGFHDDDDRSSSSSSVSLRRERRQTKAKAGGGSRITVDAPPSTVGGSALSLHYANLIIVIEKLLRYPHLVGEEARDDLYQMLPTSLRLSLKKNLKAYVKNMAIYDAPLAHDWKERIEGILSWLGPLAHNMIRWQSERNFEQHQIVKRTNVLLLQTLYFADRGKTESLICDLLVGLNYICRYEHQQNALLDCASSFDFEDCMEWQMQCSANGYIN